MGRPFFSPRILTFLSIIVIVGTSLSAAQQAATPPQAALTPANQQGVYVVLPFENAGASPRLEWLSEGLEELTIQRLSAAGEQVYSHAGRVAELERYGLPHTSKVSRATMLHMAEDLDADYVVFGRYWAKETSLTIELRVLIVNPAGLRPGLRETGSLDSLMELHTRLVWRMLSANNHKHTPTLAEFTKRQMPLRLDAFEHYARGLLASEDEAKLRELHEAARLEPEWPEPEFALGEVYYARRDYNSALAWFFKVPKTSDLYAEALFFSGVCRLQSNQADRAEEVFTLLQETLRKTMVAGGELPEILNNLAIARARQGKSAAAQADLRRATDLDPNEDDYPFNLGLLTLQVNDAAAAADSFREAAEREPDNAEDRAMLILSLEKAGKGPEAEQERVSANEAFGPGGLPAIHLEAKNENLARLSRIKTELDVVALRAEIESGRTASSAGASAPDVSNDTPAAHIRRARQELSAGHVDDAEKEFRAVLGGDAGNAAAHRGLGEIDRRRGKMDDAVKELQASLEARDSAEVRTLLAKIYLEQKKPGLARAEIEKALKLAPNYAQAKQLLEHLQNAKPADKKPGGGAQ
jgi:tetratricopeptide (TPR) repeat protein/TolB-like protein